MIPSSGHLFYVEDLATPELTDDDGHHAVRVLRLRAGEEITVADGAGSWRRCTFHDGRLETVGEVVVEPAPTPPLCVGFALVKGTKPELIVQKLTEVGVDRIVPFGAERSVVRWDDDRTGRAHQRLMTVARAAGMQSRRAWLPVVEPTASFADHDWGGGAVMADRDGRALGAGDVTVLIGPEGGWSPKELAAGLPAVSLSDQVLRAETAAIAAGVVLGALRAGHIRHAG